MKKSLVFLCLLAVLVPPSLFAEDRPIIIITPQGVFQIDMVNGIPQEKRTLAVDVVIQGFGAPTPPGDDPPGDDPTPPPVNDPVVVQIATISKAVLKDKDEATAVAALVDTLSKFGLTGNDFKEALLLAAPIADTSMQSSGRINKWSKDALAITTDPAKMRAGLISAWSLSAETLETIRSAAVAGPQAALTAEALDWAKIIQIIQLVLQLLKNLGIIPA